MNLSKRFRIIGLEVVGLASFLIFIMFLQLVESNWNSNVEAFAWVYTIVGVTLVLVGLETLSLNKQLSSR